MVEGPVRQGLPLVCVGGTARAAIGAGGETGGDSRLSTLQTDSEMGAAGITRTAGEVFSSLLEQGCAYLPALRAAGAEEGEARMGCLHDAEALLLEEGAAAPLYTSVTGWTLRDGFSGVQRDARGWFSFAAAGRTA